MMRASGKKLAEIATATGYSFSGIVKLVSKYREGGLGAIVENHYGGNRRNMSYEEESALLEPFWKKAEAGQIVEVSEIKAAYQESVGHSIGTAQIYYVLRRHRWRKVMPRSKHPKKASEEDIEVSKKLTRESGNWRKISTKFGWCFKMRRDLAASINRNTAGVRKGYVLLFLAIISGSTVMPTVR